MGIVEVFWPSGWAAEAVTVCRRSAADIDAFCSVRPSGFITYGTVQWGTLPQPRASELLQSARAHAQMAT